MSKQKKQIRTWGYNIIAEADTDFKEKLVRDFTEHYLRALKEILEKMGKEEKAKVKWGWRELTPGEILGEIKLKRSEKIIAQKNDRNKTAVI